MMRMSFSEDVRERVARHPSSLNDLAIDLGNRVIRTRQERAIPTDKVEVRCGPFLDSYIYTFHGKGCCVEICSGELAYRVGPILPKVEQQILKYFA